MNVLDIWGVIEGIVLKVWRKISVKIKQKSQRKAVFENDWLKSDITKKLKIHKAAVWKFQEEFTLFDKNFVIATFLLEKLLNSWFDERFSTNEGTYISWFDGSFGCLPIYMIKLYISHLQKIWTAKTASKKISSNDLKHET